MTRASAASWLTAADIAQMGLPGFPACQRTVRDLIKAKGWAEQTAADGTPLVRRRQSRGGGFEYHASLLPPEAQQHLLINGSAPPDQANDDGAHHDQAWHRFNRLSGKIKAEAERRLAILLEVEALMSAGSPKMAAINTVAIRRGKSASTIGGWFALVRSARRNDWLPYLAPNRKGGGKEVEIDPTCWEFFLRDYLRLEQPTLQACYNRLLENWAGPRGIVLPHAKTFKRKLDREVPRAVMVKMREGRESLRRTVPHQDRTVEALFAMQMVNVDGHTFDVFVRWEDGSIDRPVIVGIQDIYSRKLLAHRIDRSETSLLARMAFADLFRDWGIPQHAYLDNGRAFASKALTGGAKTRYRFKIKDSDPTGVLTALNVKIHWTLPYRGSSKPIERAWRDLAEYISKHPACAGAYTGNKPDAKPENYRERAVPIAEFSALVAREIALHNARPGRRTEAAKGSSFDEVFDRSYVSAPISRASPDQLQQALLEAKDCRCDRRTGEVRLAGNRYHAEELSELAGQMVSVRFDPDNLHSEIHVYRQGNGAFVCTAPMIAATGFANQAAAKERAKLEKGARRAARKAVDALDLLHVNQLAEIYSTPIDPAPKPAPGAIRIVPRRGHTVAAAKPIEQADSAPAAPNFLDDFIAGSDRHLRIVE